MQASQAEARSYMDFHASAAESPQSAPTPSVSPSASDAAREASAVAEAPASRPIPVAEVVESNPFDVRMGTLGDRVERFAVFLFDWDDTLLPTTALGAKALLQPGALPEHTRRALGRIDTCASSTLSGALAPSPGGAGSSRVLVLTNACEAWVQRTSKLHLPKVHALLGTGPGQATVVSARPQSLGTTANSQLGQHAFEVPGARSALVGGDGRRGADVSEWKRDAAQSLASTMVGWLRREQKTPQLQVLSIGDMPHDLQAACVLAKGLLAANCGPVGTKTVRFRARPPPATLSAELEALVGLMPDLVRRPKTTVCELKIMSTSPDPNKEPRIMPTMSDLDSLIGQGFFGADAEPASESSSSSSEVEPEAWRRLRPTDARARPEQAQQHYQSQLQAPEMGSGLATAPRQVPQQASGALLSTSPPPVVRRFVTDHRDAQQEFQRILEAVKRALEGRPEGQEFDEGFWQLQRQRLEEIWGPDMVRLLEQMLRQQQAQRAQETGAREEAPRPDAQVAAPVQQAPRQSEGHVQRQEPPARTELRQPAEVQGVRAEELSSPAEQVRENWPEEDDESDEVREWDVNEDGGNSDEDAETTADEDGERRDGDAPLGIGRGKRDLGR